MLIVFSSRSCENSPFLPGQKLNKPTSRQNTHHRKQSNHEAVWGHFSNDYYQLVAEKVNSILHNNKKKWRKHEDTSRTLFNLFQLNKEPCLRYIFSMVYDTEHLWSSAGIISCIIHTYSLLFAVLTRNRPRSKIKRKQRILNDDQSSEC